MTDTSFPRSADDPQRADDNPQDLFDLLAAMGSPVDEPNRKVSLTRRFEEFHEANPLVYRALRAVARQRIARYGYTGFPAVWEAARSELSLRTEGDTRLLNNSFRSFFSRLLMLQERDLAGAWETRRAPEADAWIAAKAAQNRDQAA